MYATGDRARWREGGVLELLGRQDGQVKVRGFRVELAEVEAALRRHPEVKEGVVTVFEDSGGKRLAAYVVSARLQGVAAADLRRWLKDRLPEPMVPTSYVLLEAMPLSLNGKLDRSALPPPAAMETDGSATYVPPRTIAEEILAGITGELLSRRMVGVHDNFFEIGVDSIIGIQIVSRARQAGILVDPAQLFRHPNIAELAAAAESTRDHHHLSAAAIADFAPYELIPQGVDLETLNNAFAEPVGIEDVYPLTPVQEGMLFHTLADREAGHYVEQFVCRLRGELDVAALADSWERLVARHPALRTTIHSSDCAGNYQVVHRRTERSLDYEDWRALEPTQQDERLRNHIESDRKRGFVPSRPPLTRLAILRLRDDVHQLIWSIHHLVIDGWCLSLLLHELLDTYEAIRANREPSLYPGRPFRDYVAWLNRQRIEDAEGYWREALKGITAATPLAVEGLSSDRGGALAKGGAERETFLPADVTASLQDMGRTHRLTLSTLIQGAWALVLSRYSGQSDVVFGVTVSGRPPELPGVESIVGVFINVLPLRVTVVEESCLVSWLQKLQATMVEMRRFEGEPLSRIQKWSDVPLGLPLVESIVIVQNLPFLASLEERGKHLGIEAARFIERTHYPLGITVTPGAELGLRIGFDAHRFDPGTIARTLGHLRGVLEAMVADPQQRIVDLPLLTEREEQQLLGQWSGFSPNVHMNRLDLDQLGDHELDMLMDELGSGMGE
jgi:aryl carrier-like protein